MNAIIAINPGQMQDAQSQTISWIAAKVADATHELAEAEQVAASLGGANLRRSQAASLIVKAKRRLGFYVKVKAALDAGYYIVPPFPLQLFAIRTDRLGPSANPSTSGPWSNDTDQKARSLPIGEGHFVSPVATREAVGTEKRKGGAGNEYDVTIYQNDSVWNDVVMPVRALKPQIIDEVGKALHARIFDALGIAPAFRSADPIICGEIKRPSGGVLVFFVAWWLDESDL